LGGKFKWNIGLVYRIIQIVPGLVIVTLGVYFKSWWGLAGLLPLVTAFISWYPAYSLIGISSDRKIKVEKLLNFQLQFNFLASIGLNIQISEGLW
jgi:hypothetical protein